MEFEFLDQPRPKEKSFGSFFTSRLEKIIEAGKLKAMKLKKKKILKEKKALKVRKKVLVKKKKVTKRTKKVINIKKPVKKNKPKVEKKKLVKRQIAKPRIAVAKLAKSKPSIKKRKSSAGAKVKTSPTFLAESFFKAKIKVIGIGGGGGSIVSEIGRSLHKATFVVADTDMRAQKKRQGIKYFLFGQKLTHGLGTGVNPELGRLAAESEKEKISQFFQDQDIVIFIASLGGGLGSGATKVFAEAAKNFNGITFGIFTLPFKFEGKNKYHIALKALKELRKSLNVSIAIPNERIFKIIDQNTAITDAFSMVNKNLIESLESLIDLIYSPGIINIDFADLRVILKGRGNVAFLNTAEARGKNRAEEVAHQVLHNSLYQSSNFATEKILFNIEGDESLSMFEVDKISRKISEQNPKAKIIFGISKNAALKNKIKTTLLMTGGGAEIPVPETVPVMPKIVAVPVKKEVAEALPAIVKKPVKKIKRKAAKPKLKKKSATKVPADEANKPESYEKIPFGQMIPGLRQPDYAQEIGAGIKKITVVESLYQPKKPIRRSALEIKKAEEVEEKKQSLQEKEWEIPAFMRLKNK